MMSGLSLERVYSYTHTSFQPKRQAEPGKLTGGEQADPNNGAYNHMTSAPILPNYLGIPFRLIVSPFVHFDPETRLTDILMFNSRNLGALIVAEEPHVKSWEDGQYNILNMSIEETYGFGMSRQGGPSRSLRPGRYGRTSSRCRLAPC